MIDSLRDATAQFGAIERRRELERKAARFRPDGSLRPRLLENRAIRDAAHIREPIGRGGAELWISYSPMREEWLRIRTDERLAVLRSMPMLADPDALNGYIAFPKRRAPRVPVTTGAIIQYIPVHGGVTWARKDSLAAVWGFDTAHFGSEKVPRTDPEWVRHQCHMLANGLELAAMLWPEFRRAPRGARAEIADRLLALEPEGTLLDRMGFGALLTTLAGCVG